MNVSELQREIELTRHELDETLEALHAKVSPSLRLRAAWDTTQATSVSAVRSGVGWAIAHPITVLGIAAAVVFTVSFRSDLRRLR
ncbi:MAG: DUF3618 domain-containing protein [Steroidobacteraceae bacterium]